ncbi:MAG: hypothetical protein K1X44_00450 [Alphaproteobacteria bacterium]|nr:hypothetical protein [Alphaproteobacteria bacterium]
MPQLNPEHFSSQIIWLIIAFMGLYWLISKLVMPRVGTILETRATKIADDLRKAENLRNEAENVLQAYEQAMKEARFNAQQKIRKAQDEIADHIKQKEVEFKKVFEQKTLEAEKRIAAARQKLEQTLPEVTQEIAGHLIKKLSDIQPGKEDINKIVNKVMQR